ncbi:MAG: hypothetical protein IT333_00910 [Thermomicrobiales bacterium]|nr:hypothetical protein [Thermomicrobiales bacterium]
MTTEITAADLARMGFTSEQIEWLVALRNRYRLIDHVCTAQERQRLEFLKWRYSQNLVTVG